MGKIQVGVYDEHRLMLEGISRLLETVEDIQIMLKENSPETLMRNTDLKLLHILIINLHAPQTPVFNLIKHILSRYPKIRVLIVSASDDEKAILQSLKSGAKGFLAKESERHDLLEAIYTLRNGHDYYSKSITHLLLKKYIHNMQIEDSHNSEGSIRDLSPRELEVLKLWGSSYSNQEISDRLFISVRTVESHKNHIMQKLNLKTAVDLVRFAIKNNIIEI